MVSCQTVRKSGSGGQAFTIGLRGNAQLVARGFTPVAQKAFGSDAQPVPLDSVSCLATSSLVPEKRRFSSSRGSTWCTCIDVTWLSMDSLTGLNLWAGVPYRCRYLVCNDVGERADASSGNQIPRQVQVEITARRH